MNIDTTTIQKYAHKVGFFYLFIILAGIFGQIIVRGSLVVPQDSSATVNHILTSMPWWRWFQPRSNLCSGRQQTHPDCGQGPRG